MPWRDRPVTGRRRAAALLTATVLASAGCDGSRPGEEAAGRPGAAVPEVVAVQVIQRDTPIVHQLVGRVVADEEVEVRSRTTGLVVRIAFEDGQPVKTGQLLFQIDPRPLEADLVRARATRAELEAALAKARQDLERARALSRQGIIARQELDDAQAAFDQARQTLAAQEAVVESARLALADARITSPLTGRIGASQVRLGALVQAGQTVLATVSTVDPIDVEFSLSEREYLDLFRRYQAAGRTAADSPPVELVLADGSPYPEPGRIDFVDRRVSPTTGTLEVRAEFPNPTGLLRPGLYASVRITYEIRPNTLLIPEQAVQETLGRTSVTVVTDEGVAEQRPVTMGPRVTGLWVVEEGLRPGERVVVEGQQKARPGSRVAVRMITEAQLAGRARDRPTSGGAPQGPGSATQGPDGAPQASGGPAQRSGSPR